MISIAIVDDERDARNGLKEVINKITPYNVVIWEADSVEAGIEKLNLTQPDLLFLDVQLRDGTGFDILEHFRIPTFQTIFVTAFDEYALKAFRFSAVNYLLKPVDNELFEKAIEKATINIKQQHLLDSLSYLLDIRKTKKFNKLVIESGESLSVIYKDEIVRIEANTRYSWVVLEKGRKLVSSRPMGDYEEMLADEGFVRVNTSHLINVLHVSRYNTKDGDHVIMDNGDKIDVSRRRKAKLIEEMMKKIGHY
ncbi:DNA-binding response regulator [Sphingobacteriales bacterium UPWRP_1]|nr:hypothetical protein BVG80_04570 [Sphingobacteriales bacterium TSM_CSM]PSJ76096.1 DNA-binding response regulator [Sphingobacteriales bacterium UPWRP_1]